MNLSRRITVLFILSLIISTGLYYSCYEVIFNNIEKLTRAQKLIWLIILICIVNLIIHLVILIITKKSIKKKIKYLDMEICSINTKDDIKGRISESSNKKDEFTKLVRDINSMFQSIEEKNEIIISNEKKYSNLVEGLDNGYAYFKILRDEDGSVKDAFVVEVNRSLANLLGVEKSALEAGSFIKIFSPFIKDNETVPKILETLDGKRQKIFRNSVRLGIDKWSFITVYPIEDEYFAMILTDISENRKFAEEMKHLANYDVLTGIRNRFCLYNFLDELKNKNEPFAVYYIDLDHFKQINDSLGHDVGDEVLVRTADTVSKLGGKNFTMGRLGGDEFLGILQGDYSIKEVEAFGEEIISALNAVKSYNKHPYKIEASLGASRFIVDSNDIEELLKCADTALYKSKNEGKNRIRVFDSGMKEEVMFQGAIKNAIQNNELKVLYQPIYDNDISNVVGAEALIRWEKDGELLPPDKFLLGAKETEEIVEIDNLVFNRACAFAKKQLGKHSPDFRVSINASYKFLKQDKLLEIINRAFIDNDVSGDNFRFEITEEEFFDDATQLLPILNKVKQLGIEICLDNFGVGHSSFNYIKSLPIDIIKIDRALLLKVEDNKKTLAIISALIQLSHNLNLSVIAQGIEGEAEYSLLKELGCDRFQGHYISKPILEEDFNK